MMTTIKKLIAWTRCCIAIRRFPPQSSSAALVDFCLSQPLAPLQIRSELLSLANEIAGIRPRNALEIGSYLGGTLFLLCRLADPDARIMSLDLYRGNFGGARKLIRIEMTRTRDVTLLIFLLRTQVEHGGPLVHQPDDFLGCKRRKTGRTCPQFIDEHGQGRSHGKGREPGVVAGVFEQSIHSLKAVA